MNSGIAPKSINDSYIVFHALSYGLGGKTWIILIAVHERCTFSLGSVTTRVKPSRTARNSLLSLAFISPQARVRPSYVDGN